MDPNRRAFYEYHAAMMEPWDGPAAIAFTDGRQIGATLDRNGLRPARYIVTDDDLVVDGLGDAACLPIPEERIVKKWRLQPGKMFLVDLEAGRIIDDKELKDALASAKPYREWIERIRIKLDDLPEPKERRGRSGEVPARPTAGVRLHAGGHQVHPDAHGRQRRGADRLHGQRFAAGGAVEQEQDAVSLLQAALRAGDQPGHRPDPRRAGDQSLVSFIGPKPNLLGIDEVNPPLRLEVSQPVLDFDADGDHPPHRALHQGQVQVAASSTSPIRSRGASRRSRRDAGVRSARMAEDAVRAGYTILIISDRRMDRGHVAIPALLALSAIHQHLVNKGLRTSTGLVVETGSAREVHHFALLGGYGAEAVHPYLALRDADRSGQERPTRRRIDYRRRARTSSRRSARA